MTRGRKEVSAITSEDDDKTQAVTLLTKGTVINHYRIIEKIGAGGMGEVYLAEDTSLNRKVALKFLSQHLCQDSDCRARFKREAQAAAKLDHPNIVTVYEVGEFQGRPFFAMQHVEGQTLKEVIAGKTLPLDRILEIGIQVSEGLHKAHQSGIVHRDVKPANILIDADGRAKILDFGLASVAGSDHLTKTNSTLGTIGYMSPEQAKGEEVDQRSDIFSLGVVLYEMIAGKSPFKTDNDAATLRNITESEPEPLARYKSGINAEFQRVISKALAKDKSIRYQHADEVAADLKRISCKEKPEASRIKKSKLFARVAVIALVALTVAAYFYLTSKPHVTPGKSIAIMPFADMSQQRDQEYFCDGMTDELISRLSNIHTLRVPARTSVFMFKEKSMDIRQIGEQLRVETILEGSVRRAGDKLRITAQLINVADGYHLWSQTFDREFKDVFAIQDDITTAITEKLRVTLLAEERTKITKAPTNNVEAYNLYLLGHYSWNKISEDGYMKGIEYFAQAIAKDSAFALAWAGESNCYWGLFADCYRSRSDTYEKAKTAAVKAVELDDNLGEAHVAMGYVRMSFEWDMTAAEQEFQRAYELSPENPDVLHALASILSLLGKFDRALDKNKRWVEVDPASPAASFMLGSYGYAYVGQYDSAIIELNRTLSLDSGFHAVRITMPLVYAYQNHFAAAAAAVDSEISRNPITDNEMIKMTSYAWIYAVSGREQDARQLSERVLSIRKRSYVDAYLIATIFAGLREYDTAWKWLSIAYEERAAQLICLNSEPFCAAMRSQPRVRELLKKMGFPAK